MAASLKELEAAINEKGYTDEYQNGESQRGTKKAPEVEIYNTMVKNYTAAIKRSSIWPRRIRALTRRPPRF